MARIEQRYIPANTGIRGPKKDKKLIPRGMCWHWTANTSRGAGAENHWKYWHRAQNGAHYVIDDQRIIQCVPDTELVWHAGGGETTAYAKQKYPAGTNSSLIGAELCVNADGNFRETYRNAVHLAVVKCLEYGWDPRTDFERHYDCTGKDCPRFWTPYATGGVTSWKQFIQDVTSELKQWKGGATMPETTPEWKTVIMQQAANIGLIDPEYGHWPDEPAPKWFVLAVSINLLKAMTEEAAKGVKKWLE